MTVVFAIKIEALVMTAIPFQGISGKTYTFALVPEVIELLPMQAGMYILAAGSAIQPIPLYIEKTAGLRNRIREQSLSRTWQIAKDPFGYTHLYIHPDGSLTEEERENEFLDILSFHEFPMNR